METSPALIFTNHFKLNFMKKLILFSYILTFLLGCANAVEQHKAQPFEYRVGFLGVPPQPVVDWQLEDVKRLKELGFNTIQVNIAWGYRPGGDPLNLECMIDLPERLIGESVMVGDQSPERRAQRHVQLHERAAMAKSLDMRTIFHFGAPYVGDSSYGDAPPNCLRDGKTLERCTYMLQKFGEQFPDVDDILIYTFDQHAWFCSEFGPCPRCTGSPLHERVVDFLETMKDVWNETHPNGRVWWEPWELSSGQLQMVLETIEPHNFGLAIHCTIGEVIATIPTDRSLKTSSMVAARRGIPVIAEYFMTSATEEVEPYLHIAHPQVIFDGLTEIASLPHIDGIKEYYGILTDREDPNLRMAGIFLNNPGISAEEALELCVAPYGEAADLVKQFWALSSEGFRLFPWDTSWLIRQIGRSDPIHAMSAATIHGIPWHSPSWESSRRTVFMKVDRDEEPDPWMLEDVQLQCELSAERYARALEVAPEALAAMPAEMGITFKRNMEELVEMRRRILAYAYHLRETNLVATMRIAKENGFAVPQRTIDELTATLLADKENMRQAEPIQGALDLLESDVSAFLDTYFKVVPDEWSKGAFSTTSR
jgi:hypothetical protein